MHRVFIWLLLMMMAGSLYGQAQPLGDKQDYEEAIDKFNFGTIEYVLRDDKNNAAAQQLAQRLPELGFNSEKLFEELRNIYKGTSKTEQLSRKIDSQKLNYNPAQPLKPQLDAVIQMILTDRQGKNYLPSLQEDLLSIRDQFLQREEVSTPYNAADNEILSDLNQRLTAVEQKQSKALNEPTSATPMGLTVVIVLLSLLTLVNLALAYLIYRNQQKGSSSQLHKENEELIKSYLDFELFPRIKEDRNYLEKKIAALSAELNELKNAQPENGTSDRKRFEDTIKEKIKDIAPTDPESEIQEEQGNNRPINFGKNRSRSNTLVPVKKYADYPREEGFTEQQLSDSSDRRSIYEIKIIPGDDIATFTIVDDPAIHEYAIQNRERLLKDACDFEITSSKHTRIEVQQPGRLQKKSNGTWQVLTKAKIKFV